MSTENTLRLERFCGCEIYEVKEGEVFLDLPGEGEEGVILNLEFHCGALIEATTPSEPEGRLTLEPTLEVNVPISGLPPEGLVGKTVHIEKSADETRDTWNRLYVYEHQDVWDITVSFVELTAHACRISIQARTQDPDYYDGSKPETILKLDGWFPVAELRQPSSK